MKMIKLNNRSTKILLRHFIMETAMKNNSQTNLAHFNLKRHACG
jgi:hypothetical protein